MNNIVNITLLIINIIFFIIFYKKLKSFSLVFFLVFFMQFWQFISVVYIEKGIYIVEERMYSYSTGATIRLFVLQMLFYISIYITAISSKKKSMHITNIENISNNTYMNKKELFILSFFYVLILTLLFNVIISGNALTDKKITRFNFWSNYSKLNFLFPLQVIQYEVQLINGVIYNKMKKIKYKFYCVLLYAFTLIYYLLIGNLFTQILYISFFFILPILIYNLILNKQKIKKRYIALILLIGVVFMSFKVNYFNDNPQTYSGITNGAIESLMYRALALQGHTWWGTDRLVKYNIIHPGDQISKEMDAIKNPEDNQQEAGIWYLMNHISPNEVYTSYILGNGTFNSGYPAINIAIFGYFVAAILQVLNGFLFTRVCLFLYNNLFSSRYFRIFIGSLVYYFMYEYFFMGNISIFGNTIPKLSIILFISIFLFNKINKNKIIIFKMK